MLFGKDDFEADWTKVAEGRFTQVYRVKLKIWREKCALKSYDSTVCPSKIYRWDWRVHIQKKKKSANLVIISIFFSISFNQVTYLTLNFILTVR